MTQITQSLYAKRGGGLKPDFTFYAWLKKQRKNFDNGLVGSFARSTVSEEKNPNFPKNEITLHDWSTWLYWKSLGGIVDTYLRPSWDAYEDWLRSVGMNDENIKRLRG